MYPIDLLFLYTPLAAARLGNRDALESEARALMEEANRFFTNSLMPIRYRAAGLELYVGTSESVDYRRNQSALAADSQVSRLRDQSGGDLVILLRAAAPSDTECGLGGLFNGGEQSDPPTNVSPERDAFVVIGIAPDDSGNYCHDREHLLAHELGHCMGGGHEVSPTMGPNERGPYWKPYAHAWNCGVAAEPSLDPVYAAPAYFTLMASNSYVGTLTTTVYTTGQPRGDVFSSPEIFINGLPCGIAQPMGSERTQADNRRSIIEAAPYVAAYRESRVADKGSGVRFGGAISLALLLPLASALGHRVRLRIKEPDIGRTFLHH